MERRPLLLFLLGVVIARVAMALVCWEATLVPAHPEEVGRYWFLLRWWKGFNPLEPESTEWNIYTHYAPWLPLPILLATPLQFLGSAQPYAFAILQGLVSAGGSIGAGLAAWHLVPRPEARWPAAWLAAAVTVSDPRVVILGAGMMTDQYHLSASGLAIAGLLAERRGEPWGRPLWIAALLAGMTSRYESWLLLPLCWLGATLAAPRPTGQRLVRDLAVMGAVPALWIAHHLFVHGNPVHFLTITRIYFEDHVRPEARLDNIASVLTRIGAIPYALAAGGLVLAAVTKDGRAERLAVAVTPWVHFALVVALFAAGSSATLYAERTFLAMVVLAAPVWGAALAGALARALAETRSLAIAAGIAAGAMASAPMANLLATGGEPYSARLLLRTVRATLAEGNPPGDDGPVVLMDGSRPTIDMVPLELVLPGRIEVSDLTTTSLTLAPTSVRVIVARPDQFDPTVEALRIGPPRRVRAWTDDWDVHPRRGARAGP